MKVVLVRPNYRSYLVTPPLGIGYLASFLKERGHSVRILDGLMSDLSHDGTVERVMSENPDIVGITCLTAFYNECVALSKELKKRGIRVVIGGVHPTFLPAQTLKDSKADFVICGEAELAFAALLEKKFNNKGIRGVYSLKDISEDPKEYAHLQKADIVEDLDDLPFPDWEQMDPRIYPKAPHGTFVRNYPIGILTTTRGCPYECTFCASPAFSNRRIRYRSPENVIKEVQYLVDTFGVKEIHFEDDNITLKKKHIRKICEMLIEKNIQVSWALPNGLRADTVDEPLLQLMKRSGCYYVSYGIESANEQILKNIKKHESLDVIEKAIHLTDKVGIMCQGFFVFGLPGETIETMKETLAFAKRVPLSRASFLCLDVIPGSELWTELQGQFEPDWSKNSYNEPEWVPDTLTKEELMTFQTKAFRQFFLRPKSLYSLIRYVKPEQIKFILKRLKGYRMVK